jgi:formylglycine-generating enzyme required for sulfatase activity
MAGASPYGVLDMAGNVWDWVNDYYDEEYYKVSSRVNPAGPETGERKSIRGACWANSPIQLRVATRNYGYPFEAYFDIGFRCVASP